MSQMYNDPEEQYYDNEDYYVDDAYSRPQTFIGDITAENLCQECGKRVYELEKMTADQIVYHKACFKCSHCKRLLNLSNYSSRHGIIYCKQHFIELFNIKGHGDRIGAENNQLNTNGGNPESNYVDDDAYSEAAKLNLPEVRSMRAQFESQSSQNPFNGSVQRQGNERRTSKNTNIQSIHPSGQLAVDRRGSRDGQHLVEYEEDEYDSSVRHEEEDEHPPPAITRNLVARFQSMTSADKQQSPPPGSRNADVRRTSSECRANADSKPSRSSHIPPLSQQQVKPPVNRIPTAHHSDVHTMEHPASQEVIKEEDPPSEMELPEEGLTKSLVALWRSAESTSSGVPLVPKLHQQKSSSSGSTEPAGHPDLVRSRTASEELEQERLAYQANQTSTSFETVSEEDCLPPENITQNLLERFKELETSEQPANSNRSSRSFKWDVKEVKPVNYLNQ